MTKSSTRGFWAARDLPTLGWLLLAVLATIFHRWLPTPRWLMIHLVLLGAITHAILVWSQYFSFALLRSQATERDRLKQNFRLAFVNGGALFVFGGVMWAVSPLVLVGASSIIVGIAWHALSLIVRMRGALRGRFGGTVRYYVASALMLIVGVVVGSWVAVGEPEENLVLMHAIVNLLGWVGLTVAGTVVTLWPTILRTRAHEHSHTGAAKALPVLVFALVVAAIGAATGLLIVMLVGLVGYLGGLVLLGYSLWQAARQAPPYSFAALSVGAALTWWSGGVLTIIIGGVIALINGTGFSGADEVFRAVVPFLVAGFAAQLLLGALSYLIPVVVGGGPTPVRAGTSGFDRFGPLRVAVANTALVVCALPVTSLMRVVASMLYLCAMAAFLVLMPIAMRAQSRAKKQDFTAIRGRRGPIVPEGERPKGWRAGQAVFGMLLVVLTSVSLAAADPIAMGWSNAGSGDPDAPVMVVQVEAADMRFTPPEIEVPVGTRLVIELTNTDESQTHDLVFANGAGGPRLAPGDSTTIDVGVITGTLEGWCTIVGHRQMGMTMTVYAVDANGNRVTGEGEKPDTGDSDHHMSGAIDLTASPGEGFAPYPAALEPLKPGPPQTRKITLEVEDTLLEVAPGVTQTLWTYNGTAPGPLLHGRVGDTFEVTLINSASMGHSIDFHAGELAPDQPMRTIAPGEQLTYTFTATRSGIWMYHCSTMPMTAHIANGMYGAVIIEPDDLPAVDRSYVLVQGEYYLGDHEGGEVSIDSLAAEKPDLVTFNGYASQYDHAPLPAKTGERVRFWVLDAGPNRASSFHIVGGQFDTVWSEGRYLINRAVDTGSQALGLQPAQGGFVELVFPEAGHYPFVSHVMIDAERGAHGIVQVAD